MLYQPIYDIAEHQRRYPLSRIAMRTIDARVHTAPAH
jgi:hypothetical protein